MLFKSPIVALAVAAILPSAVSALAVTSPSPTSYWVFHTANTITWTFSSGDPNPVSIIVTNDNGTFLNGAFSIAEFIPVSTQSFTVTNVTLVPAGGYRVNLVNGTNPTQVFTTSDPFEVKPAGTPPAASVAATVANPTGGTAAPGSASGTGTRTGSASSAATAATTSSAAFSNKVASPIGAAGVSAVLLGLIGGAVTFMF